MGLLRTRKTLGEEPKKRKIHLCTEVEQFAGLPKDLLPQLFSLIVCSSKRHFSYYTSVSRDFQKLFLLYADFSDVNFQDSLLSVVAINGRLRTNPYELTYIGYTRIFQSLFHNPTISIPRGIRRCTIERTAIPTDAALCYAAFHGHVEIVQLILQVETTSPSTAQNFALDRSCSKGFIEIAYLLLQDPRLENAYLKNTLRITIAHNRDIVLAMLLEDSRFQKLMTMSDIFNHAIEHNSHLVIKLLLSKKALDESTINTGLRTAASVGHLKIVEAILQEPIDLALNEALTVACQYRRGNIVEILLKDARVDPSTRDQLPLHIACVKCCVGIVEMLLKDPRVVPDNKFLIHTLTKKFIPVTIMLLSHPSIDPCYENNRPITFACSTGQTEVVELLLAFPQVDPTVNNYEPLLSAVRLGYSDVVELLIKDERVSPDYGNNKAIRMACEVGKFGIVELLIKDSRVDPSVDNNICAIYACHGGSKPILKLLLEHGVQVPDQAVSIAHEQGHWPLVRFLLKMDQFNPLASYHRSILEALEMENYTLLEELLMDKRLNPNYSRLTKDKTLNSILANESVYKYADPFFFFDYACKHRLPTALELLLRYKDIDPSERENFLLKKACKRGYTGVLDLLLNDYRIEPEFGNSEVLKLACSKGHEDIVKLLLKDGRVDATTSNNAPCRLAAINGHAEVLKVLFEDSRVDPSAEQNEALIEACKNGFYEVVELLLQHPKVDPAFDNKKALRCAIKHNQNHVVTMMLKDPKFQFE